MNHLLYWLVMLLFAIGHVYSIFASLQLFKTFSYIWLAVFLIVFLLSKKMTVRTSLFKRIDAFIITVQIILLLFSFIFTHVLYALMALLSFVFLELFRLQIQEENKTLRTHLKELEQQLVHSNETFQQIRGERHDFLKHISAVHFMLENNQSNEAKQYLDELVDGYEETNLSIKGERGVVASLLHQTYRQAAKANVEIVYDFDVPISSLPLSDKNIVGLIGNLLSNSLDASIEWQKHYNKKALVTVQCYKRGGLYLLLCKNSTLPVPTPILDHLFETFGRTTKPGNHEGLGTKIISDIVKEHNGYLDFIYKNEEFTVKIKLPAIR
ncbi:sensor histidine kinase [Alkalihalobacterium bogoriense]|uniref:sensor histidine kinase n=1 Tax=Alkalihalobacterium bogoriense TaxID=246272 RepID=UPI001FE11403|nr:GHKL domain-containing protein [Alkalihalobacterium bogoriense]